MSVALCWAGWVRILDTKGAFLRTRKLIMGIGGLIMRVWGLCWGCIKRGQPEFHV